MKHSFNRILSAILLAAMLTACGTTTPDTSSASASSDTSSASSDTFAEAAETEPEVPDYFDFVFPEETDTLVVYSSGMLNQTMNAAIEIFEELYPHINVDYRVLSEEEHETMLMAEIPAGTGPDLVFSYDSTLPDIYKTMATGVFCDLNPYLHNDEEFNYDDYIAGTFNSGMMQNKQYILPIQIQMPIIITTMGILEENGLTPEDMDTYDGFIDACSIFKQNNPDAALFDYGMDYGYLYDLYDLCGLSFIDYTDNTLTMDRDVLKKFADVCKLYYDPQATSLRVNYPEIFKKRNCFLLYFTTNSRMQVNYASLTRSMMSDEPYFTLVPDANGGNTAPLITSAAIPKNASNKLNAYRLLKILLMDEIQFGANATLGMPVRRESFREDYVRSISQVGVGITIEDFEPLIEKCMNVTRAFASPKIMKRYLKLELTPYLAGKRSFDDCYENLKNTIELYKDE